VSELNLAEQRERLEWNSAMKAALGFLVLTVIFLTLVGWVERPATEKP